MRGMSSAPTITHAQLGEMLANLHLGVGASDLHGSLTGYVCGGGGAGARGWLAALELETDPEVDLPHAAFARLYEDCVAWFDDPELRFEPLLPETDVTLDARADALVEWCRGFLGGLGLAGATNRAQLSADASEILQDFGTIAGSRFEYADAEEDESALAEVIEFIRVGALLLHAELSTAGRAGKTLH
jgi:uncharacterized protein YgfB (UPF0149 family)